MIDQGRGKLLLKDQSVPLKEIRNLIIQNCLINICRPSVLCCNGFGFFFWNMKQSCGIF